jgi:ABC-2 type transport system permease protein
MNKTLKVALKEYAETVKTKAFLIGILLTPVLMGAFIFVPKFLAEKTFKEAKPPKHLAVLNLEDALAADLDSTFTNHNQSRPGRQIILDFHSVSPDELDPKTQALKQEVLDSKIDALLVIEAGVIEGEGKAVFYTKRITDFDFHPTVGRLVNNAVTNVRYRENDLSRELVDRIRRRVPIEEIDLGAKTEKKRDRMVVMMVPFFFMLMMFMGIFTTGQGMINTVIEEKNSRVIEVVLSAVRPLQLMSGKILGQSAIGFTLVAAYGAAAYIAAVYHGLEGVLTPAISFYFIVYFILGFMIFASLFAAIGSACNDVKEAQTLMQPVMILLMIPLFAWFIIVQHPEGSLAVVLSFIPPMTPLVMILRLAAHPDLPLFQVVASILLLAASVPVVMWAAAKIFRTGILMYGKPPSLREIFRWVRYD